MLKTLQRSIMNDLKKEPRLAIDTETESLYGKPLAISLASLSHEICFFVNELEKNHKQWLEDLLEDEKITKIFHNALYDFVVLNKAGFNKINSIEDTMVMARLLDSEAQASLSALAFQYCGKFKISAKKLIEQWKPKRNAPPTFNYVPKDVLKKYAENDARLTFDLFFALEKELKQRKQAWNFYQLVERPLIFVLYEMNSNGIAFDIEKCRKLDVEIQLSLSTLEKEIIKHFPKEININSTKQLAEMLFKKLKLPCLKKTKKGAFSVDEDSLKMIEDKHPVIPLILEYRELMKLHSTYTSVLPTLVNNGRLSSYINSVSTASGRLASERPNLQNIPARGDLAKKIRECFIAEEGKILIVADYSQIELRVLAHLANDPIMINVFKSGGDIHAETAKMFSGLPKDVARANAKIVNFAMIYGASEYLLSKKLGVSIEEAAEFKRKYFLTYPQAEAYLKYIVRYAQEKGYVSTISGRRRSIPQLFSDNIKERKYGERIALNTPIQGSAADIIKAAMVETQKQLKANNLKSKMVLQIHDELIFEVPKNEKEIILKILNKSLTDLRQYGIDLSVPLEISIGIGKNWQEAKA